VRGTVRFVKSAQGPQAGRRKDELSGRARGALRLTNRELKRWAANFAALYPGKQRD
jgi:hypothetical protein